MKAKQKEKGWNKPRTNNILGKTAFMSKATGLRRKYILFSKYWKKKKKKELSIQNSKSNKNIIHNEGEINAFSDEEKLKEF